MSDRLRIAYGTGWAIEKLKAGYRVRRTGWHGVRGLTGTYLEIQLPDADSGNVTPELYPYIYLRDSQGNRGPWLCSQADLLAEDWEVVAR